MKILGLIFIVLLLPILALAEIDLIQAWTTEEGSPIAMTPSAGTDRAIFLIITHEVSGVSDIATCSLGTGAGADAFEFVHRVTEDASNVYNYVEMWMMRDTDIPSGGPHSVGLTFTGSTPGEIGYAIAMYDSVDQTSPISDSDTSHNGSAQALSITLTSVAGGAAIYGATHKDAGANTFTWTNDATEQFDFAVSDRNTQTGADDLHAGGGSITGTATTSLSAGRMAMAGAELEPTSGAAAADISYVRRIKEGEGK